MVTTTADAAARTTASTTAQAPHRTGRTAALLSAGVVVAGVATTVDALVAKTVGGDGFPALQPLVYLPFVVLGFAAATGGWALVRARSSRPVTILRVLVPVLTVLSLAPDIALALLRFIPGTTLTGVIALMLMHVIVVGVAVPVLAKALPVRR